MRSAAVSWPSLTPRTTVRSGGSLGGEHRSTRRAPAAKCCSVLGAATVMGGRFDHDVDAQLAPGAPPGAASSIRTARPATRRVDSPTSMGSEAAEQRVPPEQVD
jgi:hypothetical protein